MRIFIAATLLATLSPLASAGEEKVITLWPDQPPGYQVTGGPERNVSTARSGQTAGRPVIRLTDVSVPQLHLYPAPEETRNGTAVVVCPGGGFHILAWDLEGTEVAAWLNSLGVTAAVLKYRTPTAEAEADWLPPAQDAQRAIRWLRGHAEDYQLDPERIGIIGFSAGGKTAAMAALSGDEPLYEPLDDLGDVSPHVNFQILIYPAYLVDEKGNLRPVVEVKESTPPAFLVQAQDDPIPAANSVAYFSALTEAGVSAELHVYETGGHGYGLRPTKQPVTRWPALCRDWLRINGFLPRGKLSP